MMAELSKNIELKFWDVVIPLLTRSSLVRGLIQKAYALYKNEILVRQVAIIFVIACGGFAAGILTYSFSILFS